MEQEKRGRGRPKIDTHITEYGAPSRRQAINAMYMFEGVHLLSVAATDNRCTPSNIYMALIACRLLGAPISVKWVSIFGLPRPRFSCSILRPPCHVFCFVPLYHRNVSKNSGLENFLVAATKNIFILKYSKEEYR